MGIGGNGVEVGSGVDVAVGSGVDVEMASAVGVAVGSGADVEVGSATGVDVAAGSGRVTVLRAGGTVNPGTHALKIRTLSATHSNCRKRWLVNCVKRTILPTVALHISIAKRHNILHRHS